MSTTEEPEASKTEGGSAEQAAEAPRGRDVAYWAKPVEGLRVSDVPEGALALNIEGRRVAGAIQGFGKLWQKTYRVRLRGSPALATRVIREWKENFPKFWPKGNRFYAPITGIAPGEVAVLNLAMPGGLKLSTGVLVLYADDESFTLMTPQGHMLAGWITFSAYEEEGHSVAQAQVLIRASDPMYEVGMALGGHRKEDRFWQHTLRSLAKHFGVDAEVETQSLCVERRRQWRNVKNIWYNAAIRSALYAFAAPLRLVARALRKK